MNLDDVVRICKMLKCRASVNVDANGKISGTINFYDVKKEAILKHRKELGLKNLRKKYWKQFRDIDWITEEMTFNRVEECKIVRYEEVKVPAVPEHTERRPVYECKNGAVV